MTEEIVDMMVEDQKLSSLKNTNKMWKNEEFRDHGWGNIKTFMIHWSLRKRGKVTSIERKEKMAEKSLNLMKGKHFQIQ